jgi:hypothetical protein
MSVSLEYWLLTVFEHSLPRGGCSALCDSLDLSAAVMFRRPGGDLFAVLVVTMLWCRNSSTVEGVVPGLAYIEARKGIRPCIVFGDWQIRRELAPHTIVSNALG